MEACPGPARWQSCVLRWRSLLPGSPVTESPDLGSTLCYQLHQSSPDFHSSTIIINTISPIFCEPSERISVKNEIVLEDSDICCIDLEKVWIIKTCELRNKFIKVCLKFIRNLIFYSISSEHFGELTPTSQNKRNCVVPALLLYTPSVK